MTATERLRELLDERGVEHYDGIESTLWLKDEHGYRASADELTSGRMSVHIWCDTPEQAIAATLGAETCHDAGGSYAFICSECGCRLDVTDVDGEPTMWLDGMATVPRYCPNCGRKVTE